MMTLNIGDTAPDFTLETDAGEQITLSKLRGQKVLLYFYPRDYTPGCTREACDFRNNFSKFKAIGITVLGISKDNQKTHREFKEKLALPFTLLTDPNGDVCEAYGVTDKSLIGKIFNGIKRSTFLIDEKGNISAVWRKVWPFGHAEKILNEIKSKT